MMNLAGALCTEPQPYGDPTELNKARLILDSVGKDVLGDIMTDYLGLLQTSAAVYEANGDYAHGIFASGWCRKLNETSRQQCGATDNQQAMSCGKWHCHESCWKTSKTSIDTGEPTDLPCLGGIRIYAVPIRAKGQVIGSINFGYGDPPTDPDKLREIADRYGLSIAALQGLAESYPHRESWVIEVAKQMLRAAARVIGTMVERNQAEHESRRLSEELRFVSDIVEQSTQPFAITTHDGRMVKWNPAFEQLTGYSNVELQNLRYQQLTPERWHNMEADRIAHMLATGKSARFEKEYQRKDGAFVAIEAVVDLRKRAEGEPSVFCRFVTDITARKQARTASAESESRLRLLLDSTAEAIYGVDLSGNCTFCNSACLQMLGYAGEQDLISKNMHQLIHHTRADGTAFPVGDCPIYLAFKGNRSSHVDDEVFWRADGTAFQVEYSSHPIEHNGQVIGAVVTFVDISERRQIEAELTLAADKLRLSEESLRTRSTLLQSIIDSMGEGVVVADEMGTFLHWNPAAEEILGLGAQNVSPERWTEVYGIFQEDQVTPYPAEELPLARAIRGHDTDDVELFVRHSRLPAGSWIVVTGRPVKSATGRSQGGVIVIRDITESRNVQKRLFEHEMQLREACRIGHIGYWEYGFAEGVFTFTDSFYDLLNTSAENENGYQMSPEVYASRFLHADEQQVIGQELKKAITSPDVNYSREFESTGITADRQARHFQVRFRLVRDAQGQPLKLVGANQDVTQQVLSEKSLRESEERLRVAVIAAPFPVMLHAEGGEVILVSQVWTELSGFGRDELRTTADWAEFAYGQRKEQVKADIDHLYDLKGRRREGEYIITTRNGEQRTWDFSSAPLAPLSDGRRLVISMAMDVTERKQAEEQLQKLNTELEHRVQQRTEELENSRDRFKAIFEESPIGIAVIDSLSGKIIEVNPQFAKIAGRTREEMTTIDWMSITHPDDLQEDLNKMADLNAGKIAGFALQKRYCRPNGTYVWIHMTIARITVEDSDRPRHLGMIEDISDRKLAQDEIINLNQILKSQVVKTEEANKELEAFSYSVSHDLRAPLRAIDGFSKILLKEHAGAMVAEAQEYLQDIRTNTHQMGHLVDDLLAFSRLSRQPVKQEIFSQNKLVRQCIDELNTGQKGRQVEFQIMDLPDCSADPALIKQVWLNLLDNAIKYTSRLDVAKIEVGSHVNELKETVYFIKDNGVGFDMRYADKLFGVFQRLHRAEDYEGTGVGLAIVQRVIHRHRGRVWAEAEPDKGAAFFFTLGTAGVQDE